MALVSVEGLPARRPRAGALRPLRLPPGVGYALALAVCMRVAPSLIAAWALSMHPPREPDVIQAQYLGQTPLHDLLLAPWQRFAIVAVMTPPGDVSYLRVLHMNQCSPQARRVGIDVAPFGAAPYRRMS